MRLYFTAFWQHSAAKTKFFEGIGCPRFKTPPGKTVNKTQTDARQPTEINLKTASAQARTMTNIPTGNAVFGKKNRKKAIFELKKAAS